jgi:hypothetical protein
MSIKLPACRNPSSSPLKVRFTLLFERDSSLENIPASGKTYKRLYFENTW